MTEEKEMNVVPFVVVGFLFTEEDDWNRVARTDFVEEEVDQFVKIIRHVLFKKDANVKVAAMPVAVPPSDVHEALKQFYRILSGKKPER